MHQDQYCILYAQGDADQDAGIDGKTKWGITARALLGELEGDGNAEERMERHGRRFFKMGVEVAGHHGGHLCPARQRPLSDRVKCNEMQIQFGL